MITRTRIPKHQDNYYSLSTTHVSCFRRRVNDVVNCLCSTHLLRRDKESEESVFKAIGGIEGECKMTNLHLSCSPGKKNSTS